MSFFSRKRLGARAAAAAAAGPDAMVTHPSGLIVPAGTRADKALLEENWTKIVRAARACDDEEITFALYCKKCRERLLPARRRHPALTVPMPVLRCACADRVVKRIR